MSTETTREEEEALQEETRAPLIEHLIELRQRLLYALLGLICTFFVRRSLMIGAEWYSLLSTMAIGRPTFAPVHLPKSFWYSFLTS